MRGIEVTNVHASLLPAFGGKGFYGLKIHQAVLASGATESGCTLHRVSDEYDVGEILGRLTTTVLEGDTAESLSRRIASLEPELVCSYYDRVFESLKTGSSEVKDLATDGKFLSAKPGD
jgi:folate-dependent phosphoribosylglycinamide formyltransferase PurN